MFCYGITGPHFAFSKFLTLTPPSTRLFPGVSFVGAMPSNPAFAAIAGNTPMKRPVDGIQASRKRRQPRQTEYKYILQ